MTVTPEPDTTRNTPVTFSPLARIIVGLAGLLLVGLLAVLFAVLGTLNDTRTELVNAKTIVERTDGRLQQVSAGLDPLLSTTAPLGDPATRQSVRRAARSASAVVGLIPGVAGNTRTAAAAAQGITTEIQGAGLGPALTQLRGLAETGTPALSQLSTLAQVGTPALQELAPRLSRLLASLDVGPATLAACDQRLRTGAPSQAGQLACVLRLLPNLRGQLRTVRRTLDSSLRVQSSTRILTATTVDLFQQSLAIQRELLVRVRSLDTKFGGPAPVADTP